MPVLFRIPLLALRFEQSSGTVSKTMGVPDILRYVLSGLGYLLIAMSLVPLLRSNWWFVRIFDYPRSQKFWLNVLILTIYVVFIGWTESSDVVFITAMCLNLAFLFSKVWEYTKLAPVQMKVNGKGGDSVRLLVANVYQDNRDASLLLGMIDSCDPDLILLVETDAWWLAQMSPLYDRYSRRIEIPKSNTYGMVLLSRLEISDYEVRYIVEDDVPSIQADIVTSTRQTFRLYGLHPKPPVPQESGESTERDAEILIVAKECRNCRVPVIVAGDLNDVAWSFTTSLFLKVSGLLDPRIGRGFFSTFHAKYRLMRWPLDHVFCSSHFYLHNLKRMGDIGSDHFPILIEVGLEPYDIPENAREEKVADQDEIEIATEKIASAKFEQVSDKQ